MKNDILDKWTKTMDEAYIIEWDTSIGMDYKEIKKEDIPKEIEKAAKLMKKHKLDGSVKIIKILFEYKVFGSKNEKESN